MLLGLLVVACNGDTKAITWAPLDIEQLEEDVESPTAALDEANLAELFETPVEEVQLVKGLLGISRLLIDTAGEGDMESITRDLDVNLEGTQVYLRIACTGPIDVIPDPEFRYGSLTVYSAGLSQAVIDTWGAQGDMLGVLEGCVIGRYTLDGRMRMYYDTIRNLLGVDFEIEWSREGGSGNFTLPATDQRDPLDETAGRGRVLFTTEAGETLVIEQNFDLGPTEYIVRGADDEVVCDSAVEPPCPPV
jgi:hypothetical protein